MSITAEIGTSGGRYVLESIVDENYRFWNRSKCGQERYKSEVKRLRELFNPQDAKWQKQVVLGARQMCKALARFSKLQ